ncbi:MAG: metallophosphoesterase [Thermoleophilia bacterium]
MGDLTARERRLRRALIGMSMVAAVTLLAIAGVVFYWWMYLLGPEGSPFTRGPYLLRVDRNSAELRWRTDGDRDVRLTALDDAGREVVARGGVLDGLRPGTRYTWTASVDGVGAAAGAFGTPSVDPDAPVRIAAIADYGIGGDEQYAVARTMAAERPDLVLTAGDNSYLSAPDIALDRNVFRPMAELMRNAPVYVGLGDHEALPPGDGAIRSAFDIPPGGRYVVEHGPVQAVMLGDRADAEGIAFARRQLARPGFRHRFLVQHRPPQPGQPLVRLAREEGVDAIISGHLHRYERRVVDGVRCFTVGTGGGRIGAEEFTRATAGAEVSLTRFGHLRIDIRGEDVRYTFVDLTGRVADRAGPP